MTTVFLTSPYLYPSPAIPSLLSPTRHSSVVASSTIPLPHFPYFPLPSILTGSTTIVFEFPYPSPAIPSPTLTYTGKGSFINYVIIFWRFLHPPSSVINCYQDPTPLPVTTILRYQGPTVPAESHAHIWKFFGPILPNHLSMLKTMFWVLYL